MQGFRKESERPEDIDGILFTGGEPTLNPLLRHFVADAAEKGYTKIGLQTNGRLLKYADHAKALLAAGLNEINISLHGNDHQTHDAHTRTPGSFSDTYAGLCNILALKKYYPLTVSINFTITRLNANKIPDFLAMINKLGKVDRVILNMLMFSGNAKRFFSSLKISYRESAKIIKRAAAKYKGTPFNINAIPRCILKGHEPFSGTSEQPLTVKKGNARNLRRSSSKIKSKPCRHCPHQLQCEGIDAYYAKMIGWKEFNFQKE